MLGVIPWFTIPSLFDLIHPFGVLVATGILVGAWFLQRRAKQLGLDHDETSSMITWSLAIGFVFAHVFDVVAYDPEKLLTQPWVLVDPRHFTISSFGGFIGGLAGIIIWCKRNKKPFLPFGDAMAFGLIVGWCFGRTGCFVAHDHPGMPTHFFLAVNYPDPNNPGQFIPRLDLGLLEMLMSLPLVISFQIAFRKVRRVGSYLAAACIYYAPVRFVLDFLRETPAHGGDVRYFGLTPAQYGAILVFATGVVLALRVRKLPPGALTTAPAVPSPAVATATSTGGKRRRKR